MGRSIPPLNRSSSITFDGFCVFTLTHALQLDRLRDCVFRNRDSRLLVNACLVCQSRPFPRGVIGCRRPMPQSVGHQQSKAAPDKDD